MDINSIAPQSNYDFASMAAIKREANGNSQQVKSAAGKISAEFEAEFLKLMTNKKKKANEPFASMS